MNMAPSSSINGTHPDRNRGRDFGGMTRLLGLLLGILVTLPTLASAQSAMNPPDSTKLSQQFVLLRNDHVLRGYVINAGNLITVRRGPDSELTLRADQVLAIRDDLGLLYEARRSIRRRRADPSVTEMLDDLRWCVDQRMSEQATDLLIQIYRVVPDHPIAKQLEARLRQRFENEIASASETTVVQTGFQNEGSDGHDRSIQPFQPPLVHVASAPRELSTFTSRIQPILVSRCGQCHDESSSSNWMLELSSHGTRVSQMLTIENLHRTLIFCHPGDADGSPLYQNALIAHGHDADGPPPIAEYESRLIATLRQWIEGLDKTNSSSPPADHCVPDDVPATNRLPADVDRLSTIEPSAVAFELTPPPKRDAGRIDAPLETFLSPRKDATRPVRLPQVENPNDVRFFNREFEVQRALGLIRN